MHTDFRETEEQTNRNGTGTKHSERPRRSDFVDAPRISEDTSTGYLRVTPNEESRDDREPLTTRRNFIPDDGTFFEKVVSRPLNNISIAKKIALVICSMMVGIIAV